MIRATMLTMALALLRDRAALALAFLLPPLVFVVFGAVLQATDGSALRPTIVLAEPEPPGLRAALGADPAVRLLPGAMEAGALRATLRAGGADAGVLAGEALTVLVRADRPAAGQMAFGAVQRALARLAGLPAGAAIEAVPATGASGLAYYAGAIAVMFLLFAAAQGAGALIEEREHGVTARLSVRPRARHALVLGKFAFLTLQGCAQTALILLVAALWGGVAVVAALPLLVPGAVLAAAAAAGLALLLCAACRTRQQAVMASTFLVLILSAVGGSMVPRYMMPDWLRELGLFTPNAWMIEAFSRALVRAPDPHAVLLPWGLLAATALGALAGALALARRRG